MPDERFQALDSMLERGEAERSFDLLQQQFRDEGNYPLLMEAKLMQMRHALGLPLIQTESIAAFPPDKQALYEAAFIEAARETGDLFLAAGKIERAWPYFRAIGEPGPVASAIAQVEPGEGIDPIIDIAFQQGVHPVKGLELILGQYGMCRAITSFGMVAVQNGRDDCIRLLTMRLHAELLENLRSVIESNEGSRPETADISELVRDRDWLFGEYSYYVDTSHVVSVVQYSTGTADPGTLTLVKQLCDYGARLSPQFQPRGEPPFDDLFRDYGMHARVLLREEVEQGIAHFRRKVESAPEYAVTLAAQVLVQLLVRLERYAEALDVSVEYLRDEDPSELMCPTALQLCHMAGDYERLKSLAKERGDLLSYAAAVLAQK